MCSENLGDCTDALIIMVVETVVDGEPKGGGALDGTPPHGKDGCAHTRFGGEEGHDHAQQIIGEFVEAVVARQPTRRMLLRFCLDTPDLLVCLDLHLDSQLPVRKASSAVGFSGVQFFGACSSERG